METFEIETDDSTRLAYQRRIPLSNHRAGLHRTKGGFLASAGENRSVDQKPGEIMRRALVATILLATVSFSQDKKTETTSLGGPLRLRDQGSFYVNGKVAGPATGETVL